MAPPLNKLFKKRALKAAGEWLDRQPAALGKADGTLAADTQGIVWVRLINGKEVEVWNQRAPLHFDLPVIIGRSRTLPNVWQVIECEEAWDTPAGGGEIAYHGKQHEEGGGDRLNLDRKQIMQLSVRVSDADDFIVTVFGGIVITANGPKKIATQAMDLSSYVVTSGAKVVTLEADDDGIVTAHEGTPYADPSIGAAANIPTPDSGKYPFAGVVFYDGQAELADSDIFLIVPLPGAGGGGTTDVGAAIHAADEKVTIHDDDEVGGTNSEDVYAPYSLTRWLWSTVKAWIIAFADLLYLAIDADYSTISANDAATDVTGAELEQLTDGSETTLHTHAGGAASPATNVLLNQNFR